MGVLTYQNAVFQSKNFPKRKMAAEKSGELMIKSKNPEHFRVISPGLCGYIGSISFIADGDAVDRFLTIKDNREIHLDFIDQNDPSGLQKRDSCFYPRNNKYFDGYTAYEAAEMPNYFIRHRGFKLWLDAAEDEPLFKNDASWKTKVPESNDKQVLTYQNAVFQSKNFPKLKMTVEKN